MNKNKIVLINRICYSLLIICALLATVVALLSIWANLDEILSSKLYLSFAFIFVGAGALLVVNKALFKIDDQVDEDNE